MKTLIVVHHNEQSSVTVKFEKVKNLNLVRFERLEQDELVNTFEMYLTDGSLRLLAESFQIQLTEYHSLHNTQRYYERS
jgi:putative NADPH-quinone reductase